VSLQHKRDYAGATAAQLIPPRVSQRAGTAVVNSETALRHSAVWAALRLRANLVSTMPVDGESSAASQCRWGPSPTAARRSGVRCETKRGRRRGLTRDAAPCPVVTAGNRG